MRRNRAGRVIMMILLATVFLAVFSFVVMRLWNWLTPALFGWHLITYWQAVGVLILSKILFGGFRGHSGRRMHWRGRMMERWGQMTPEDREKFRQSMRGRCGPIGPSTEAPKA